MQKGVFTSPQPFDLLPFAKKEKFQCLVQKIIMARLFPKQLSWFTLKRMECFLYRVHFFCPCPFIPVFFIPICSTVFFLHPYVPSFSFPIYERWVYCFIPEKKKKQIFLNFKFWELWIRKGVIKLHSSTFWQ